MRDSLESEFHLALDDAGSSLVICISKSYIGSGRLEVSVLIELQAQARISAAVEGADRVVHEVVASEAELQLPALRIAEREVLKYREIVPGVGWSGQGREDILSLLAWRLERRKTFAVHVLM